MMITLGIETSCDETGIAVIRGDEVLSNVVTSSIHLHKKYGGVVPEIASRYHVEYIAEVLKSALNKSDKSLRDIDLVAVTNGPGLVGALLIGISMAKSISYAMNIPIIGVNHIVAHLFSSFITEKDLKFPFVGLVVSGGHTALFYCKDVDKLELLGQTHDDAVGEAYDKVAKLLGLGYPGGPIIEKTAGMSKNTGKIMFPRSFMGKDSFDFSFSGVKTAVLYYVRKTGKIDDSLRADICHAFQESVLDVIVEKACRACRNKGVKNIVVGGGVAANGRLRQKLYKRAEENGLGAFFPKFEYCLDNGAMIGILGQALYKKGYRSDMRLSAMPNLNI